MGEKYISLDKSGSPVGEDFCDVPRDLRSAFGFRMLGFWFRVTGSTVRDPGFGIQVSGFGFRILGFGSQVSRFKIRVLGSGFRVLGFGFQISDFRFRSLNFEPGHGPARRCSPCVRPCSCSQPPHKLVNLSFTITNIKNKLTNLCGN